MKKSYLGILFLCIATLNQIQTVLKTSRRVDQFFRRLRNLYNNSTENNLQPIQDYANTIVNNL